MGLFDFIKSAGKKLGIGSDDPPSAEDLKTELESHKLGTEKVDVEVKGDRAILRGNVGSQDALEKAIVAVGNTIGIGKVESEVSVADAAPAAAKEPRLYTVKKGDNLWKIAEAMYGKGKGKLNTKIFDANRPMLTHPDKIYPGQVLRIPDA